MIDFIYFLLILVYAILIVGFLTKEAAIVILGGMGIILAGIYIFINGMGEVSNFLTFGFSTITMGVGSYVMIVATMESIPDF